MNETFVYSNRHVHPRIGDSYDSHTMGAVDNVFHIQQKKEQGYIEKGK